jgi:hypothetical protein
LRIQRGRFKELKWFSSSATTTAIADDFDMAQAKQLMLGGDKPGATPAEKEIIEFGKAHRDCNIRIMPG